ncbi:hypothetical protein KQI84_18600 [bacterium]|nr:hypothetical protein [bacterium]
MRKPNRRLVACLLVAVFAFATALQSAPAFCCWGQEATAGAEAGQLHEHSCCGIAFQTVTPESCSEPTENCPRACRNAGSPDQHVQIPKRLVKQVPMAKPPVALAHDGLPVMDADSVRTKLPDLRIPSLKTSLHLQFQVLLC